MSVCLFVCGGVIIGTGGPRQFVKVAQFHDDATVIIQSHFLSNFKRLTCSENQIHYWQTPPPEAEEASFIVGDKVGVSAAINHSHDQLKLN